MLLTDRVVFVQTSEALKECSVKNKKVMELYKGKHINAYKILQYIFLYALFKIKGY